MDRNDQALLALNCREPFGSRAQMGSGADLSPRDPCIHPAASCARVAVSGERDHAPLHTCGQASLSTENADRRNRADAIKPTSKSRQARPMYLHAGVGQADSYAGLPGTDGRLSGTVCRDPRSPTRCHAHGSLDRKCSPACAGSLRGLRIAEPRNSALHVRTTQCCRSIGPHHVPGSLAPSSLMLNHADRHAVIPL